MTDCESEWVRLHIDQELEQGRAGGCLSSKYYQYHWHFFIIWLCEAHLLGWSIPLVWHSLDLECHMLKQFQWCNKPTCIRVTFVEQLSFLKATLLSVIKVLWVELTDDILGLPQQHRQNSDDPRDKYIPRKYVRCLSLFWLSMLFASEKQVSPTPTRYLSVYIYLLGHST